MSTYLVAFVVGELEHTDPTYWGASTQRVVRAGKKPREVRPGGSAPPRSRSSRTITACRTGRQARSALHPDFAPAPWRISAHHLPETALLVDETAASHAELERGADVVAHENAHMWFGDS